MLRKIVPVLALLVAPAIASAQFEAGDYEVTLAGTANATKETTQGTAAASGTLGYFLTKEAEIGAGQQVTYESFDTHHAIVSGTNWGGQTNGFVNYHFDMGAIQPFVGGVVAYDYPEGQTGAWLIAPVVGVKYFVNGTTFVFGDVGYFYDLNAPKDSFFSGTLGIGFRF